MNAREIALNVLYACHYTGAWADGALKRELSRSRPDSREAALASRLTYGVLQQQLLLDYYLGCFSKLPLEKWEPRVLEALRLGAYQLLFADRIPPMAAVNESVNLAKRYAKNPKAAGMVNAILRNVDRQRDALPSLPEDWRTWLSLRYSHPLWLVEELGKRLDDRELELLLAKNNEETPIFIQINTLRRDTEQVRAELEAAGVSALPHPWLPDCLILEDTGDLTALPGFRDGLFYIQDPAAKLAVLAAAPHSGERVLDLCAAPGGKSFSAAIQMGDRGLVVSRDLYPHKVELLRNGVKRLGFTSIDPQVGDATEACPEQYDLIIADVPCSGLGIIRKKPDIRYKSRETLDRVLPVQSAILDHAAQAVAPGGRLLYATCTLRREENEGQIETFLDKHSDFTPLTFTLPEPFGTVSGGQLTLWPQRDGTDGFYFALLGREGG